MVIEEFGRTFILANLHVAVVGHGGYQTVVSYLVGVVGGRAPLFVHGSNGFGVGDLVAGVFVGGQAKLVCDPFTKVTRAISLADLLTGPSPRLGETW